MARPLLLFEESTSEGIEMAGQPAMSFTAFEEHLKRAGLTVTSAKARELYPYVVHLEAMTARMRADLTYADEPAHIFVAGRERAR